MEEGRTSKISQNQKTESLRDLMLGKKGVKKLPENFFEKVLDLELKLKRNFNLKILQELVSYYSVLIKTVYHSFKIYIKYSNIRYFYDY